MANILGDRPEFRRAFQISTPKILTFTIKMDKFLKQMKLFKIFTNNNWEDNGDRNIS